MTEKTGKSEGVREKSLSEAAFRVLENLGELEPELVNAAILDADLEPLAVTSSSARWQSEAVELLKSLEAASGDEDFDSAQIAEAEGEVFAVAEGGLYLVAVTGRFVLASLTSYDMRMALRDLARFTAGVESGNASAEARNRESDDA